MKQKSIMKASAANLIYLSPGSGNTTFDIDMAIQLGSKDLTNLHSTMLHLYYA